ncbi:hypothetical protein BT69DRAFT_1282291 [Atractiella rhizophila]|nr:hypothetical protein BT69DRAFT_1282291 [Atractiella rhizophila]
MATELSEGSSKRQLPDDSDDNEEQVSAKRPRRSINNDEIQPPTLEEVLAMSISALQKQKKERLVSMVQMLQVAFKGEGGSSGPMMPAIPEVLIEKEADRLRATVRRGIEKQMKWVASAKQGNAKFSYENCVTHKDVFLSFFHLSKDWNKKTLKIDTHRFESKVLDQECQGKVRYDVLRITSGDVSVKWDPDSRTFSVSGRYGKPVRE